MALGVLRQSTPGERLPKCGEPGPSVRRQAVPQVERWVKPGENFFLDRAQRVAVVVRGNRDFEVLGDPRRHCVVATRVELAPACRHEPEPIEEENRDREAERRCAGVPADVLFSDATRERCR